MSNGGFGEDRRHRSAERKLGVVPGSVVGLQARFAIAPILAVFAFLAPISGFDRALPGYEYQFPRDHFAHPNFAIEWR